MLTSSAKNKGRELQKYVRDRIYRLAGFDLHDVKSTPMGTQGADLWLSKAAQKVFPVQFECKNRKAFAVYKDYEQAKSHGDLEPVLIIKQNRSQPLAIVDADYLLQLIYENSKLHAD